MTARNPKWRRAGNLKAKLDDKHIPREDDHPLLHIQYFRPLKYHFHVSILDRFQQ